MSCLAGFAVSQIAQASALLNAPTTQPTAAPAQIDTWVAQLADPDYQRREAATNELIASGAEWVAQLQTAHDASSDAEVRVRLRFVLDNVSPPSEAVLALRDSPDGQLRAGDLITHLDGRRIRDAGGLYSRLQETDVGAMLRIRRDAAPLEIGPLARAELPRLANYRLPQGLTIRRALQLYRDGFAEQAWTLLRPLTDVDETELPAGLRAIIAYTAGDATRARELFPPEAMMPVEGRVMWTNPSGLDLIGPLQAPYQFEFWWLAGGGPSGNHEPDMLVQRVLIPAHQYMTALKSAAELWWSQFRLQLGNNDESDRKAGNMIALVAWMLSALDLPSECIQLIEPRSLLLGAKWVRVQADAWPELLAGNPAAAVDRFWDDARVILDDPQSRNERAALTRNANVAATVALFLYQVPDDPRVQQMLDTVAQPEFNARGDYLRWMLFALNARNEARIRHDLAKLLPQMRGDDADQVAWALAVLSYVSEIHDPALTASARERVAQSADAAFRQLYLPQIDAMVALRANRPDDALQILHGATDAPGAPQLRSTAEFIKAHGAPRDGRPGLRDVLAAAQLGAAPNQWIVLTRERRWLQFDAATQRAAAMQMPTEDWFPGVVNWPWLGREPTSGRVWAYDRRRVTELGRDPSLSLRLNVEPDQIAPFDAGVSPVFSAVAEAVTGTPISSAERGEFLRSEIKAYSTYVSDPNLHDLAFVESFDDAPERLHLAIRGGPQMLVNLPQRKVWTSSWIAERLGLERPPTFFVQPLPGASPAPLFLMSDQGLLRFDPASETLTRLPLTSQAPFPSVVPESCPYVRRDPRWMYCARLPEDGGRVYRLEVATGGIEELPMENHVLPANMYRLRTRDRLRADVETIVQGLSVPSLATFIRETRATVRAAQTGPQQ